MLRFQKLKGLACAYEYAKTFSDYLNSPSTLENAVEQWDTFKRETLETAKLCIGERPWSRGGFASEKTLVEIESRGAWLLRTRISREQNYSSFEEGT